MTESTGGAPVRRNASIFRKILYNEQFGLLLAFVVICVVFGVLSPCFFTLENWGNIGIQTCIFFVLSCGMTVVILTQGIDLSVAAVVALSSVLAAQSMITFHNS